MLCKSLYIALLTWSFVSVHAGCVWNEKITRRSELADPLNTGVITVLTKDSTMFELNAYRLTDSALVGAGSSRKDGKLQQFYGQLRLSDIAYIQTSHSDVLKTVLAFGVIGVFGIKVLSTLSDEGGFALDEHQHYYVPYRAVGGGSCPYIYTYDGDRYQFESETFAGAIFKGAERSNFDALFHLKPIDGRYLLRLTDERPETYYVNEIKLIVVDGPASVEIIPDNKGSIHTISNPVAPLSCYDLNGNSALPSILKQDRVYWESDLSGLDFTKEKDLRDGLVMEFQKPQDAKHAKLVVDGTNTMLGLFAFEQLFKLKGDDRLKWYQQLETDPAERMKMIKFMMREGMLHIKIFQNNKWIEQAALVDVGPKITKEQVAMLDVSSVHEETVKIKIESVTDLWRIDRVYIDYSSDAALTVHELAPVAAIDESGKDVARLLSQDDGAYYITLPGQFADLTFREIPPIDGMKRSYVVKSKGYYHQWFDAKGEDQAELLNNILTIPNFGGKMYLKSWKDVKQHYR